MAGRLEQAGLHHRDGRGSGWLPPAGSCPAYPSRPTSPKPKKSINRLLKKIGSPCGRHPPDVDRDHVDELREFPLPVAQSLLRGHEVVDVDVHAVPLDDVARVVAQRLCAALDPPMGAVGSALTISPRERCARLE